MEELRRIHSEGNTIIMVTHNPNLTTYATRVIHMLDGGIDEDIKTVSDEDLPVPIHDRIERDDEEDNDEPFIYKGANIEADTSKFEERKNLLQNRIADPDELSIVTEKKSTKKPVEKAPVKTPAKAPAKVEKAPVKEKKEPAKNIQKVNKSEEKPARIVKKAVKNSSRDIKRQMPQVGLYSSGDPGFRIKEKPSIEELIKKEKK
jgi:energy-coupling factor transporter ATP-binding protein EcfA2